MFNFNQDSIVGLTNLETTFNQKQLILLSIYKYNGPVTMQFLPYGGIQSVFHGHLIINTKEGFIACDKVIYDGKEMTSVEFIEQNEPVVNQVLPN